MLIVFNWKLNPPKLEQAKDLFESIKKASKKAKNSIIVVCPPFEYLFRFVNNRRFTIGSSRYRFGEAGHLLYLGAQDCFWESYGSCTGEVSPLGLKLAGVDYVILGHSERRKYLKETNEMVNKKVISGLSSGLKVILCLGEDEKVNQKGEKYVNSFLEVQLKQCLKSIENLPQPFRNNLIITYEPVWAISDYSGNLPESSSEAAETIKFIKQLATSNWQLANLRVLYGGSVNSKNISGFLKHSEIDGFLVGHASLNKQEVKKIIAIAEKR
jgi:triosephosphate isomerase